MLIITADDLGRNAATTDAILECYRGKRITSSSIMVFMADSERAAESALDVDLETGLHLNLDLPFDGPSIPDRLREAHFRISSFLGKNKWAQVLYNPLLKKDFEYVFRAQYEEYARLFHEGPMKIDGHNHLHLCANILVGRIIPRGLSVRRNFTFGRGEKGIVNRVYRRCVDKWLIGHYRCTDAFFSIEPLWDEVRLNQIASLAKDSTVELMVHPAVKVQHSLLMSAAFFGLIRSVPVGNFQSMISEKIN